MFNAKGIGFIIGVEENKPSLVWGNSGTKNIACFFFFLK